MAVASAVWLPATLIAALRADVAMRHIKTDVLKPVKTYVLEGRSKNSPSMAAGEKMKAGFRVAQERMRLGLSQQELAARVTCNGYKISQTGIDKIEKRDTERPKCLKELALALGITEEWLLSGNEPRQQQPETILDDIRRDIRRLNADEQETLFAQLRSLLDIALRKKH